MEAGEGIQSPLFSIDAKFFCSFKKSSQFLLGSSPSLMFHILVKSPVRCLKRKPQWLACHLRPQSRYATQCDQERMSARRLRRPVGDWVGDTQPRGRKTTPTRRYATPTLRYASAVSYEVWVQQKCVPHSNSTSLATQKALRRAASECVASICLRQTPKAWHQIKA